MRRAEILRKFDAIVDFAGVAEFIDTPVKRYSSGMNARLGFAVAAQSRAGRVDHRRGAVGRRSELPGESATNACSSSCAPGSPSCFVSHNLSAISTLCDRVLVLRQGQVEVLGPTHDAITIYAGLVQQAKIAEVGRHEVNVRVTQANGMAATEIESGSPLRISVSAISAARRP